MVKNKTVYLFLDVDGVLNNTKHYQKLHKKYNGRYSGSNMPFNPRSLRNLAWLVKKTNAKIVLDSSWRNSERSMYILTARLMEYGIRLGKNPAKTPYCSGCRGDEIKSWLRINKVNTDAPENIIMILDDDIFDIVLKYPMTNITKINNNDGLTLGKTLECYRKIKKLCKEK